MNAQPIGQLLDSLGVAADLDDGDVATDAYVILKVVKANGDVAIVKATSESLDWITALDMLTASQEIEAGSLVRSEDDE